MQLKEGDKHEQIKHKSSRRKEIIKIRAEINEIGTRNDESNSWFFKRINKSAQLIQNNRI